MQPVQKNTSTNLSTFQQGATSASTNKRNRNADTENKDGEHFEERVERAAKKQKTKPSSASELKKDRVTIDSSLSNEMTQGKIHVVAIGSPPLAPKETSPTLRDEILSFFDQKIKNLSARPSETFPPGNKERLLAYFRFCSKYVQTCPSENFCSNNPGEPSLPHILAAHGQWDLIKRLIREGHSIDFNSSPNDEFNKGETLLLMAAVSYQWDLVRDFLKNHKIANINACCNAKDFKGLNIIFSAASNCQWDIVTEILQKYPHVNVNFCLERHWKGMPSQVTVFLKACLNERWDVAKLILATAHDCKVDNVVSSGPNQGISPLWVAANHKQWDLFLTILRKDPYQDINAKPIFVHREGRTVIWLAAFFKRWDVVSEILDLCPKASVNTGAPDGDYRGGTPLLLAAEGKRWDIVEKMLMLKPDADVDAAFHAGANAGITPFWHAIVSDQWHFALRMLSIKPRLNLECVNAAQHSPLALTLAKGQPGFAKLLLMLGAKEPAIPFDVHCFETNTSIPVHQAVSRLRQRLEETRSRIYDILYNHWNAPQDPALAHIRNCKELRSQIACDILCGEHPDLPVFPNLPAIVEEWANLDARRNEAAKERTAILAYREFRWNNGVFINPSARTNKDIRNMILDTLNEVEKSFVFDYSKAMRKKIVKSIGESQSEIPRITPLLVSKAIIKAVAPSNNIPA